MFKYAIFTLLILSAVDCKEKKRQEDPFAAFDRHLTHTLAYHYLWPWSQLFRAAAALEAEDNVGEAAIVSEPDQFAINLNVKRFKPDELRIKVKNRYIIVEGKHRQMEQGQQFMANHFVQRFALPAGSQQDEVTAVLNESGILTILAPKHDVPPPPPEREVPIQVKLPENKPEDEPLKPEAELPEKTVEHEQETKTDKKEAPVQTSSATPLEQLDLVEATTHVGKIRKKELKTTTKTTKDNEVTKGGEGNGLDYTLIEPEE